MNISLGKRYFLIGFILSILISLFLNFPLLMRFSERLKNETDLPFDPPLFADHTLYFSLIWFFLLTFILFISMIYMCQLGDVLFKRKEYKVFLFAIGITLIIASGLFLLFPSARHAFTELFIQQNNFPDMLRESPFPGQAGIKENLSNMPPPFFLDAAAPPLPRPSFIIEHLFAVITVILTIILLQMLNSRQQIALEYEKLKTESLQSSYNALMGQVNPHFFFNSLNGLSSLVHADDKEKTLIYIDKLSSVFRYILQSNKKELVELGEELQFVKSYIYLLEVRYEGKLFFSIQIDANYLLMYMPILSMLPLIENAVKHNIISKQYPLQVDIYSTAEKEIVVSNNIQLRIDEKDSGGLGLKNLWGRYRMLTKKDICITDTKGYFKVTLPLQEKQTKL